MRTLRLVALSDDGTSLVLAVEGDDAETGERFELPIDDRLRAAARGDARRLTQIDVDLGTELPPRVIQQRIRSGETPEQVAAATGARVERIMRFAHPVLQERERVAEQAREARVRLSEGSPTVVLHRFMTERLRLIDTDLDVGRAGTPTATTTAPGSSPASGGPATSRAPPAGPSTSRRAPSRRTTPRRWTSPRAPAWSASSPTCRSACPPRRCTTRAVPCRCCATTAFATGPVVGTDHLAGRSRPPGGRQRRRHPDDHLTDDLSHLPELADDEHVRDVHPADGRPGRGPRGRRAARRGRRARHDRAGPRGRGECDGEDPRARIPAWEDIVFGVRRHR